MRINKPAHAQGRYATHAGAPSACVRGAQPAHTGLRLRGPRPREPTTQTGGLAHMGQATRPTRKPNSPGECPPKQMRKMGGSHTQAHDACKPIACQDRALVPCACRPPNPCRRHACGMTLLPHKVLFRLIFHVTFEDEKYMNSTTTLLQIQHMVKGKIYLYSYLNNYFIVF